MQRQAKFRLKQQAAEKRLELADVEEHIEVDLWQGDSSNVKQLRNRVTSNSYD